MNYRKTLLKSYFLLRQQKTLDHLKLLEESQYYSIEDLKRIQYKKLKKLLQYSYENVPYYKNLMKSCNFDPRYEFKSLDDIKKIPILTKDDINSNISLITSKNYPKKFLKSDSTGGSTGRNLKFYSDLKKADIRHSFVIRGDKWAGLDSGTKHAFLWGSAFDKSHQETLKGFMLNKLYGILFLSSYKLSDRNMSIYAKKIDKFNPKVIISYPSSLYTFSKYIEENNIKIPQLKSIITSAETLYDFQREHIESTFSCEIFNRYGCREFGPIAHECSEHSGLHINMEHLNIEFIDENNYRNSKNSKIIITDLDNYAMPFIRYEIGDDGFKVSDNCDCGRNLPLMNLEGRSLDVVVTPDGNRIGGTFWTLLFRTYVKGIEEFQLIQESYDEIIVNLKISDEFCAESIKSLELKIKEICGQNIKIKLNLVEKIKEVKSGKKRYIISKVGEQC